ncbi:MAG: phage major capsid protein [Gemmatimonadota bacterium]
MNSHVQGNLEHELRGLTDAVREADAEAAERMEAAEGRVQHWRDQGVNPLTHEEAFADVDAAYQAADGLREQASRLRQRRERVMEMLGRSRPAPTNAPAGGGDLAGALMDTPEYQRLATSGAFHGQGARIEIPGVEVVSRDETIQRMRAGLSLLSGNGRFAATADVGAMIDDDQRRFPPIGIPVRAIRLMDLVTVGATDSDQIIFVEETTRTDAAAETALGTAYAEASYVYTERTSPVRDIGHFTPAHRSNLADRGQVQSLLEGRLQNGVERRLESQMLAGDGVGVNLRGILNTTGIGTVARNTAGGEPRVEAIHRAITAIRLALFGEPDGVLIHPTDYEETVFEKGTDGQYLLGPVAQQSSRTLWGFPAVVSNVITANTSLVGNFRSGAVLWMRAGVSVRASDSHASFFTERRVALLAELRAAFAAWQPQAFCTVTAM